MDGVTPDKITVDGVDYVRAYDVTPGRCPHCGADPRVWTAATIVAALTRWTDTYGHPPTSMQWHLSHDGYPSSGDVIRYYGSWDAGLRAAGLPSRQSGGVRFWTDERITEAMQAWARKHGCQPTSDSWRKSAPDHPSSRTVIVRKGSWNNALDDAGFFRRGPGGIRLRVKVPAERIGIVNAAPVADVIRAELATGNTLHSLAGEVGVDESYLGKIVNGKKVIRADYADRILCALDRPHVFAEAAA